MDEDSKMLSDPRPVYQVGCLPPEVLQIVLSHVVTRNDYRAWIRIASVCRSFARCLELYLPFDTVEVGRSTECVAVTRAAAFPRCYFPPPVPAVDALPLQLMEKRGPVALSPFVHRLFMNNITSLNVMACCPRTCTAVRVLAALPQMRQLSQLSISLAVTDPQASVCALLVANMPASVRHLHASLTAYAGGGSRLDSVPCVEVALRPFSRLHQLHALSLDVSEIAGAGAGDCCAGPSKRRSAHYELIQTLFVTVMEAVEEQAGKPCSARFKAWLDFCRTLSLEMADLGDRHPGVTAAQLDQVTHALGVAIGALRAVQAVLPVEDAAAVQEVLDRVERECCAQDWLDLRGATGLKRLQLRGVPAVAFPSALEDLDAHGLECHAPLPQTLRAYTGSTAYLGTCVAHLSWCRLRHVVLQQRPACEESCGSVGEPLTVPDEVGLPQLHFRCLESISLSGQPLQIGVLKSVLEAVKGAPRLREVAWLQAPRPGSPPGASRDHLPAMESVRLLDDLAEQAGLQAACLSREQLCWRKRGS